MLKLYHRLGHPSFHKMRIMAKQGIIPRRFEKSNKPVCAACTYTKIIKKPWRNKKHKNYEKYQATEPGEVISVDQLVFPTPGFIAQMIGKLTTKKYKYATIFMDQFSKAGYVHIQRTSTAEETLEGKRIFKSRVNSLGVKFQAYQADNGIFRANASVKNCTENNQKLIFTGVNIHHQNGHAEKRIRDLQDIARKMIMHASKQWPSGITTNI